MTMDDMDRIRRAVEGGGEGLEAAVAKHGRRRRGRGRGAMRIAWAVVVGYLMFLFAYLGYLFARSHLVRVDVTGDIIELVQVFLLPLVMLVLGYAFGASRR